MDVSNAHSKSLNKNANLTKKYNCCIINPKLYNLKKKSIFTSRTKKMSPITVLTVLAICCGVAVAQIYGNSWRSNDLYGDNFLDNTWDLQNDFQNDWRMQRRNNFVGANRWNNRRMVGSRFVNRFNRRTSRPFVGRRSTGELNS